MTIVPRTGPLSASSALASTSWYQRGKSSACAVSTFAIDDGSYRPARFLPEGVAAGSGSGPGPGGAGDRPADAVEGAAVELVGHHGLLAGAAVGVVVGVMRPGDLDLPARHREIGDRGGQRAGHRCRGLAHARDMHDPAGREPPNVNCVFRSVGAVGADDVHHGLVAAV